MEKRPSTIRRADAKDLHDLMPMVQEFCEIDAHPFDHQMVRSALKPLLEDNLYGAVWLIGEPPLGYVVVTWGFSLESGGRDALIDEFYLRERGSGLGSEAIQQILAELARQGFRRVFLETEPHNEAARRFYARQGFRTEESIWMSRSIDLHDGG